jgi:hypothetical protein
MITDNDLLFATAAQFDVQAATPEGGTNVYDTAPLGGNAGRDLGTGEILVGVIIVTTSFATGTSLRIDLVSGAAAPATGTPILTPNVHWTSGAILTATLVAGYMLQFNLPPGNVPAWLRYVGFNFTAVGNYSAGNLTLLIQRGAEKSKTMETGMNIP